MAVVSVSSGLAISTKGIQAITAREYSSKNEGTTFQFVGDLHAFLFGLCLFVFWGAVTPALAQLLDASVYTTLSGGSILIGSSVGSRALGKFQGLSLFGSSQIAIVFATIFQIPVVLIALLLHAPLSVIIGLLSVPSFAIYFYTYIRFREIRPSFVTNKKIRVFNSSAQSTNTALVFQFPILFLGRHFSNGQIGFFTGLIFLYSIGVSMSSVFGSFLLPKYIHKKNVSIFQGLGNHIFASIPVVGLFLFLLVGGTNLIPVFLGAGYSGSVSLLVLSVMSLSYFFWSVTSSLVQERLASVSRKSVIILALMLIGEMFIYLSFNMSAIGYFLLHGLVALCVFLVVIRDKPS
jgi:O-antigen/teichoic acid export membrane protein